MSDVIKSIQGRDLGRDIAKILGIPTDYLKRLELIFEPSGPAVARCEFLVVVNTEDGLKLRELLHRYEVVKKF